MIIEDRHGNQRRYWFQEEKKMNTRYNNNESLIVRSEGFWHSVWKRIEGSPRDEMSPVKREVLLEPPRDCVIDTDNHSPA
jgi:hypothetical protein